MVIRRSLHRETRPASVKQATGPVFIAHM